jgi:DNA polymerase III subunit delta
MFHILYGLDDYSLSQYIDEIKAGLGGSEMLKVNTSRLEGQRLTAKELADHCHTVPFLSPYRLVIVDGLLGLFEVRQERQQSAVTAAISTRKALKEWQNIEAIIKGMPESTVLIMIDAEVKNNNPLFKRIGPLAEVRSFPLLKGDKLRAWIKQRLLAGNTAISERAVTLLIELIGSNLWSLDNEVQKLLLYVHGRNINERDVAELADYSRKTNIFVLVDAIVEGNTREAQRMLHQMYREGSSTAYILFMITRQVRLIALARDFDPGLSKWQIQNKLGLVGYPLEKTLKQARSYDLKHVSKAYAELLQTDLAIKRGTYGDDQVALEIMLLNMGRLN